MIVVGNAREEPAGSSAQAPIEGAAGGPKHPEETLCAALERAVGALGSHIGEEPRHATNGRRIRAPVVINHDDEVSLIVVGDVVERFPGHPTGQGAVADDSNNPAVVLGIHMKSPRNPLCPTQRTGGMRAFDNVVFGFRTLRIARKSTLLPKLREVLAAGEKFVDIGLVAGIPDERIPRRVEYPVQGDRQLDHA